MIHVVNEKITEKERKTKKNCLFIDGSEQVDLLSRYKTDVDKDISL